MTNNWLKKIARGLDSFRHFWQARVQHPPAGRILWIHAGGHKTGTKAIQNYLYLDGLATTAPSLYYRKPNGVAEALYLNSGNGHPLFEAARSLPGNLPKVLGDFMGDKSCALVSTEEFSHLSSGQWQGLDAAAAERGVEVRVVFFIRDLFPCLLSFYDQLIKGGILCEEFPRWAEKTPWVHAQVLRNLVAVIPRERIRVVHYDSARHDLLASFFRALGIPNPRLAPVAEAIGVLNRSLTTAERSLLLQKNREHGTFLAEALNRGLQAADPRAKPEPPPIPVETAQNLQARFSGDIDWINRTFFEGHPAVGLGSAPETSSASEQEDSPRLLSVHRTALKIVLQEAAQIQENTRQKILGRLKSLDRFNLSHPDLPADFDPAVYLLLNPDLVEINEPLLGHYLRQGQKEGRAYRLPPKN